MLIFVVHSDMEQVEALFDVAKCLSPTFLIIEDIDDLSDTLAQQFAERLSTLTPVCYFVFISSIVDVFSPSAFISKHVPLQWQQQASHGVCTSPC